MASSSPAADRAPPARPPLLTLDDALARLLAQVQPLPFTQAETVSTFDALGRVLAAEVRSLVDVPPADNSAMDGYALCIADLAGEAGAVLPVGQRIAAGGTPAALKPGTAARIFTGAQVPEGADAVVMQEHCEALDGAVKVLRLPAAGQSIRRRGEDVCEGSIVLPAGTRLTPQALGLAASVGMASLSVMRRPRVALFSTGDELVMPGETLKPGAIYNSNRFTLRALVQALGCECTDYGIVPDRLDATREMLRRAAHGHDLVVSSGGVSVGEEDHLRPAVQAEGSLDLWQIAIKPGKPLAFGSVRRPESSGSPLQEEGGSAWFVGLPGNPVSSFITFLLAVRPLLHRLQGRTVAPLPQGVMLRADFDCPADRRREFLRVRRNAQGGLDLFANQGSGVLTSAVWGDGLVDNPMQQAIARGDLVRYIAFSEWFE
jgi:molybdopterin molybdotransferase